MIDVRLLQIGIAVVVGFNVGWLLGTRYGRRKEYRAWTDEVVPEIRRLKKQRNTLWRSAVSKTQKLNRITREMRGR